MLYPSHHIFFLIYNLKAKSIYECAQLWTWWIAWAWAYRVLFFGGKSILFYSIGHKISITEKFFKLGSYEHRYYRYYLGMDGQFIWEMN